MALPIAVAHISYDSFSFTHTYVTDFCRLVSTRSEHTILYAKNHMLKSFLFFILIVFMIVPNLNICVLAGYAYRMRSLRSVDLFMFIFRKFLYEEFLQ